MEQIDTQAPAEAQKTKADAAPKGLMLGGIIMPGMLPLGTLRFPTRTEETDR